MDDGKCDSCFGHGYEAVMTGGSIHEELCSQCGGSGNK